jgi:hypothetical protein
MYENNGTNRSRLARENSKGEYHSLNSLTAPCPSVSQNNKVLGTARPHMKIIQLYRKEKFSINIQTPISPSTTPGAFSAHSPR